MDNNVLQQILEEVKSTNSRLDKLEQGQAKLEQGQTKLEQELSDVKATAADTNKRLEVIESELPQIRANAFDAKYSSKHIEIMMTDLSTRIRDVRDLVLYLEKEHGKKFDVLDCEIADIAKQVKDTRKRVILIENDHGKLLGTISDVTLKKSS